MWYGFTAMTKPPNPFLQAVTDLANEHGVAAFALAAAIPDGDDLAIIGGAASGLPASDPLNDEVLHAMQNAVHAALMNLRTPSGVLLN